MQGRLAVCEINPKHQMHFHLEAFTSDPNISVEDFVKGVLERVFKAEMALNADGKFRFHIHDDSTRKVSK